MMHNFHSVKITRIVKIYSISALNKKKNELKEIFKWRERKDD